mmetsp:Transcript_55371/g.160471  ORF Transcript_55371/g.160471 Transcript_55371/m.160471 type:complete len:324 (+) Transcript_55371:1358-2329(+)
MLCPGPNGIHVMLVNNSKPKIGPATSCHGADADDSPNAPLAARPAAAAAASAVASAGEVPAPEAPAGDDMEPPGADVDTQLAGRESCTRALASACQFSGGNFESPAGANSSMNPDRATYCFTPWWTLALLDATIGSCSSSAIALSGFPLKSLASCATGSGAPGATATPGSSSSSSRVSSSNHRVKLSRKPSFDSCRRYIPAVGAVDSAPVLPAAACASELGSGACLNGGCKSHKLSNGLPSAPAKSSNSVKCVGNKSNAHNCTNTSRITRHSASRKSNKCCAMQRCAALKEICARGVKAPELDAFVKFWHNIRTRLFTESFWP